MRRRGSRRQIRLSVVTARGRAQDAIPASVQRWFRNREVGATQTRQSATPRRRTARRTVAACPDTTVPSKAAPTLAASRGPFRSEPGDHLASSELETPLGQAGHDLVPHPLRVLPGPVDRPGTLPPACRHRIRANVIDDLPPAVATSPNVAPHSSATSWEGTT